MTTRYEKLFSLPGMLYTSGSPVIVVAGTLLKDLKAGGTLGQLKIRNISSSIIKALTVSITAYDVAKRQLGDRILFHYLDLMEKRDSDFGQNVPIPLPNPVIREIVVSVLEVIFADGTIWNDSGEKWESLPLPEPLDKKITEVETRKQFRIHFGNDSQFFPSGSRDLWYCACGAINRKTEDCCHKCGKLASELFPVDIAYLENERNKRLFDEAHARELAEQRTKEKELKAQEERERERQAQLQADKQAAALRARKKRKILIAGIAVVVIAATMFLSVKVLIPNHKYSRAESLMNEGRYEEAISVFQDLGDYKDAANMAKYTQAEGFVEAYDYSAASREFEELGDYKDSPSRFLEVNYAWAEKLMQDGDHQGALSRFGMLGNYKDAPERVLAIQYARAEDYYHNGDYILSLAMFSELMKDGYADAEQRIEEVLATVCAQASELEEARDYSGAIATYQSVRVYRDVSSEVQAIKGKAYNDGMEEVQKGNYENAFTLFKIADDYLDSEDYTAYCGLKSVNFEDGKLHSLVSVRGLVLSISDKNLQNELKEIEPIRIAFLLEGEWKESTKYVRGETISVEDGILRITYPSLYGKEYDSTYSYEVSYRKGELFYGRDGLNDRNYHIVVIDSDKSLTIQGVGDYSKTSTTFTKQ